jgi:hypothetical protein
MTYTVYRLRLVTRTLPAKVKRALCKRITRHRALIPITETFPAGIKPWKFFRCWCGACHRETYAAQIDSALR